MTLSGATQNVITQMMDIAEPMANLRTMLEQRLQCNLSEHDIYLQNSAQVRCDTHTHLSSTPTLTL